MSQKPRPPGLEEVARDALKQVAHLAIGLASLPMIGLTLLAARKGGAAREPTHPEPGPSSQAPDAAPSEEGADPLPVMDRPAQTLPFATDEPVRDQTAESAAPPLFGEPGPKRADVEAALQTLSQATIGKPPRPRRKAKPKPRDVPSPPP